MCVSDFSFEGTGYGRWHGVLFCQNNLYRNCIFRCIFPRFPVELAAFCFRFAVECLGLGRMPRWGRETWNTHTTPDLMIWEGLFVWEGLCLWPFGVGAGMRDADLGGVACIACHCWDGGSARFGYHGNYDNLYQTPPSYAVARPSRCGPLWLLWQHSCDVIPFLAQLWCHSVSAVACGACLAPGISIVRASAGFEGVEDSGFLRWVIFLKSINSLLYIHCIIFFLALAAFGVWNTQFLAKMALLIAG